MSALLPHIKSHRALAKALHDRARVQLIENQKPERAALLEEMALAYEGAADDLERQVKAQTTDEDRTTWHPLGGDKRKV